MASIQQHLAKAKQLTEQQITTDLMAYIRSIEAELINYNQNQINVDSKDIFGKSIGFYSKATEAITGGEKRAGQPFTGYDTGAWLESFYLKPVNGGFQFWAKDYKTGIILQSDNWLSHDLFGLSDANLSEAIKVYFLPFFQKYFRNILT